MYDLPSEDPKEPGLPDEFHDYQPQLLRETFQPPRYMPDRFFVGTDLNLYYTLGHPTWHKRPDWFAVLGVSRLYHEWDLRLSYVMWQEVAAPYVVVELLSPSTEQEDLGHTDRDPDGPPTKWAVYEQILRIPYYIVFSRYTDEVRYFELTGGQYREVQPAKPGLWLPEAGVGVGRWFGTYQGLERQWLRCYDASGAWILTPHEQEQQRAEQADQRAEQERQRAEQADQRAEQERQRAEQANQRVERLAAQLKALGINPEQ
jgi:Uma2 family endonuclease